MYRGERGAIINCPIFKSDPGEKGAHATMERDKESPPVWSKSGIDKPAGTCQLLETPLGLRKLTGSDIAGDFSGFEKENKGTMRRLVSIEREIRFTKELLESLMTKYEQVEK